MFRVLVLIFIASISLSAFSADDLQSENEKSISVNIQEDKTKSCFKSEGLLKLIENVDFIKIEFEKTKVNDSFWVNLSVIQSKLVHQGEFNCYFRSGIFECRGDDDSGNFSFTQSMDKERLFLKVNHLTFGQPDDKSYSIKFLNNKKQTFNASKCK